MDGERVVEPQEARVRVPEDLDHHGQFHGARGVEAQIRANEERVGASVSDDWRQLSDNGKPADLPIIATSREEVLSGSGMRDAGSVPAPTPTHPASRIPHPGLTPIVGPAARLAQNMTDSLSVPTATSFRDIPVDLLDARRKELNVQLAARGKKVSFTHLIGFAIVQAAN